MNKRIIKNGWVNFKRNSYVSVGTTGVMALSLLLCLALLGAQYLTSEIITSLQDKVDISAYFKNDASEDQILQIKNELTHLNEVENVEYINKNEALEEFKNRHQNDALIQESLAQLEQNPLSALLNIRAKDSSQYAAITKFIENNKFRAIIDKISFYENKDVIGRVEAIAHNLTRWGLVSAFILASIAILVTFNTIRLTIYNQKREIEIMRLVGASNWQVRGPFITEGALYGIFAAIIALALFYPGMYLISDNVTAFTSANLLHYFTVNAWQIGIIIISFGLLLGMVSSYIAIRRYLKI